MPAWGIDIAGGNDLLEALEQARLTGREFYQHLTQSFSRPAEFV